MVRSRDMEEKRQQHSVRRARDRHSAYTKMIMFVCIFRCRLCKVCSWARRYRIARIDLTIIIFLRRRHAWWSVCVCVLCSHYYRDLVSRKRPRERHSRAMHVISLSAFGAQLLVGTDNSAVATWNYRAIEHIVPEKCLWYLANIDMNNVYIDRLCADIVISAKRKICNRIPEKMALKRIDCFMSNSPKLCTTFRMELTQILFWTGIDGTLISIEIRNDCRLAQYVLCSSGSNHVSVDVCCVYPSECVAYVADTYLPHQWWRHIRHFTLRNWST